MKTNIVILSLTGFMLTWLPSFSQSNLKLGHVNFEEVMLAMPERDSAQAVLDKETKEFRDAYEELTVAYNKMYDEYEKGLPSYSAVTKKLKEEELLDKQKRLSEFEQSASVTLQKRNNELLQPIIEKANKAIAKVAVENAFTYILDLSKGSVVYTSKDSQNITPLVLDLIKVKK